MRIAVRADAGIYARNGYLGPTGPAIAQPVLDRRENYPERVDVDDGDAQPVLKIAVAHKCRRDGSNGLKSGT
jgi:hypothetical protein